MTPAHARLARVKARKKLSTGSTWQCLLGSLALLLASCAKHPSYAAPALPEDLEDLDPAVAELVRRAHGSVEQRPDDAEAWATLAMVYEQNKLPSEAVRCYAQALALDPAQARLWYRLALTESELGHVDAAIADIERMLALGPRAAHAEWRLGSWRLRQGELDLAAAAFRRAQETDPRYPGGPAGLARVHLLREENDAAIALLEAAQRLVPGDPYVRQLLGAAYRQAGRVEEAQAYLGETVPSEPAWADPWADEMNAYRAVTPKMRAKALSATGQVHESVRVLEELCSEGVDQIGALSLMGEAYYGVGDHAKAISAFEKCLALEPQNVGTHVNLAIVHEAAGQLEEAIAILTRALALRPDFGRLHQYRGQLLHLVGRHADAIASLDAALRCDARDELSRIWIGRSHLALGELDAAEESFRTAALRDPCSGDAHVGLAAVHLARAKPAEARPELRLAAQQRDTDRAWYKSVRARVEEAERGKP